MRRDFQLLAGAAAAAAVIALAARIDLNPEPSLPPAALAEAPAPASPDRAPDRTAALTAEITHLAAALHDREAEVARLEASLGHRDTELDRITAARDAEIRELKEELAVLRAQAAFDAELAALKSAVPEPAALPIPAPADPDRPPGAGALSARDALLAEIQFESASAALTPGAHMRALAAAAALGAMQLEAVRVVGHADTVGRPEANRALSAARAAAVAELLVNSGLARELIDTTGAGEAGLPVATADGVPEPLNRSVSIIAIPTRLADAG